MNELALFAGAGGGLLASHLLGRRIICAVERDAYAAQVLAQRQNDGAFKPFPIWSDVTTFDGRPWRGRVDVISGGFPCQDISAAGGGAGIDGERSGLWKEYVRIIREIRPRRVEVENSPMLTSRGLGVVLGDLAALGFNVRWGVVSAADTGAPHLRERIWIAADANSAWESQSTGGISELGLGSVECGEAVPNASNTRLGRRQQLTGSAEELANASSQRQQGIVDRGVGSEIGKEQGERSPGSRGIRFGRWPTEPGMGRVANGVAHRVDRIKALGNGQVPRVAAAAFTILSNPTRK